MKLAVVGCGAIGGVVGAMLHKAGADVVLVDTNQAHVDAIRSRGLLIDGDGTTPATIHPPIVANAQEIAGPLDVVFLAVKSTATRVATESILPHLAPTGVVVSLQNGMGNEEAIAAVVGPERMLSGVVGWGATFTGPGHITRTSSEGGFELGAWDGGVTPRVREVAAVLNQVAPTVPMGNIRGAKWTKLVINATINSLGAALGRRLGEMVADPRSRLLMLQLITEAVTVARADGVRLEKVNGKLNMGLLVLESRERAAARRRARGVMKLWRAGRYRAGLAVKSAILRQMAKVHGHIKSSMWQDIEAGRRTEIDVLNGYIVERARALHVPVPVHAALVGVIKEIEAGTRPINAANMDLLEAAEDEEAHAVAAAAGRAPTRVVCLGGGYVAIFLAKALRKAVRRGEVDLTVISRDNYHTFHGFVAEMLTGRIQPGQIISPARRIFRPGKFHNAEITGVNFAAQTVTTSRALDGREYTVPYDQLVVALGSVDDLSRYAGLAEHALRLKTYADCFEVRNHLLTMLELAEIEPDPEERRRLLTFVVAGGNYAGIEVASDLVDWVHLLAHREYPRLPTEEIRVIVVHSGETILPELYTHQPKLVRWAQRYLDGLKPLGLEFRMKTRLAAATPEEAVLNSGERIATRTIISCTGTAQVPLLDTMDLPRDKRGRIVCNAAGQVEGRTNLWAAGDCGAVPHPEGGMCPPLGIYALEVGRHIGRNIVRMRHGQPLRPFRYPGLGDACSLGRRRAVAHVRGVPFTGVFAWLVWRGFLLRYVPTWDRKLRLMLDWLVWPLIGRDIVNMKVADTPGVQQALFEAGQTIIKQGDIGREVYVIQAGEVEVVREGPEGETRLAVLGPGEHFGEMAVFQNVRRSATVRARTQVRLLVLRAQEAVTLGEAIQPLKESLARMPQSEATEPV
ncbi:MAG TPA: 2-dehydropantoate 2-reductase [Gemmatimonadales bacterium]|nr:2-dehydropantoate 2-reductase [Gemmatimonadales bacterium]